jgi:proteasome lid subunit RPN8/RPN11
VVTRDRQGAEQLAQRYAWAAGAAPNGEASFARLALGAELVARLEAFGRSEAPFECCGIGIGPAGEVAEFHPLLNVHEQPVTRYEIGAADQLRIFLRAEERGWGVTLVFHTHPATEAYPSETDVQLAGWPDAVYAIMSLADLEAADLRAFRIVAREITELTVLTTG